MAEIGAKVAVKVTASRPGYQTTEFWVAIITAGYILINGHSPESEMIAGAVAGVYALVRGYVKGNG